jgi:hypothetical protein
VRAGNSSLLRPLFNASTALLAAVSLALAPAALAAGEAPDPSPGRPPAPDPYPTQVAPAVTPRAPVPVRTQTVIVVNVPATPVRVAPTPKPKHRTPVVREAPTVEVASTASLRRRLPSLATRVIEVAAPSNQVSRSLALAVAGVVLLSATLLAGAAREVRR